MALLGVNLSQQLGFTVTATTGTTYTHGLGFTPTVILLTLQNTATPAVGVAYTLATSTTVLILTSAATNFVDVLCGRMHSLIQ